MVLPALAAALPAIITAAGSIGGGYLASRGRGKESKLEKQRRHLIDDLLASLNGGGIYGDLFSNDPEAFQKAFVDPAKSLFNNQIAPQIQQQFIASGQQRGTGLDDQLLRAGVDLDQLLNQHMMDFYQQGQNRKFNAINNMIGMNTGQPQMSSGDRLMQSGAGYLSSNAFADAVKQLFPANQTQAQVKAPQPPGMPAPRPGYSSDWRQAQNWGLGNPNWSNY